MLFVLMLMLSLCSAQFDVNTITSYVNNYRNMHQTPYVVYDFSITQFSQLWAQSLAQKDFLEHGSSSYGENIAKIGTQPLTDYTQIIKFAIDLWYGEVSNYNYNNPGFSQNTGHFTALVWASTRRIGVGVAISKTNNVYVVMNFDPPGNIQGNFSQNVFPLQNNKSPPPPAQRSPPPPHPSCMISPLMCQTLKQFCQ
jgi:glioma pathogenesis-related protein 2